MNIIQQIENEEVARVMEGKKFPDFNSGDTVIVKVRILGEKVQTTASGGKTAANKGGAVVIADRTQNYEGVVIGRKNRGINSSFTVRKISSGEGVERIFPLNSPNVLDVTVVRKGAVRRAKLYYLRDLKGKAARITEETSGYKVKDK